ncbi:MAG TPA: hypothetical protein IAB13_08105 [Candidatus Avanaerovorax faecigallinarum]|nr:hypothetical protein [Candidatus Avanaerovorax faecigallinarum]
MQERELISRLVTKDGQGIDALAEEYGSMIRYVIRPVLAGKGDEELCFARVIENVLAGIHLYDVKSENFAGWITSVAHDTAMEFLPQGRADTIAENDRQKLDEAVSSLSQSQKIFFYRKYYYMQSDRQMAGEMATEGWILGKWMGALRQKLKPYFGSSISDSALDEALTNYAHGIPPAKIVRDVNPWRSAMYDILLGMGFFFGAYTDSLGYVSMAVSTALLLAGFAALRETNRFFRAGFYFSVLRVAFVALYICVLPGLSENPGADAAASAAGNVIELSGFLCLFLGIRALTAKNALKSPALPLTLFAVMYIAIGAAYVAGYRGSSFNSIYELVVMFIAVAAVFLSFFRYIYKGAGFGYDIIARPLPHFGPFALLIGPIVLFLVCAGIQELIW